MSCDSVYMLVYKRDKEDLPKRPSKAIMDAIEKDDQAFAKEQDGRAVR